MSKTKKIFVIGGAGYIGSHVSKRLLDEGYDVYVYDFLETHHEDSQIFGKLIQGNILDSFLLSSSLEKIKPDLVIHLASFINIQQSIINPSSYYTNNLLGSIHILNAVKKHSIKHFIFSSSCSIYGASLLQKNKESDAINPKSPYARIKYTIEKMIEDYSSAYGFNFINFRIFNVSGIDKTVGFKRPPSSKLSIIPLLLQNASPFHILGHNFVTKDKTAICDYVHVKDVTEAMFLGCNYLFNQNTSQTLNLGSGQGHSVLEIIKEVENVIEKPIPYILDEARKEASYFTVADLTRLHQALGFNPHHSDIRTIISSEII